MTERGDRTMTIGIGDHHEGNPEALRKRPCALLWEESFLWGVMARQALSEAGLPFDILRAEDVRAGALDRYLLLFVPGGWASNKISALGGRGMEQIRRFVDQGGSYLGICGGAGMATRDGLGLLPIARKPRTERVPSFSGGVRVATGDPLLLHGTGMPVFHAWWPSQFRIEDRDIRVIATYLEAQPGAFSADIPIEAGSGQGWAALEERYGILLDPDRLIGEPAVVAGRFGSGKVLLSLLHFDTPADRNGAAVLRNLWDDLAPGGLTAAATDEDPSEVHTLTNLSQEVWTSLKTIEKVAADWVATGERNFLWYWRTPCLLQWRRGVRGLECSTLVAMIAEIRRRLERRGPGDLGGRPGPSGPFDPGRLLADLEAIRRGSVPFVEKAKRLLIRERFYMQDAPLSPLHCNDEEIRSLRWELFGTGMNHGGEFKRLIDALDGLLREPAGTV
jgi:putative intracellular protease/amidase